MNAPLRLIQDCDHCDRPITGTPVRDPVAVSWIGAGAPTFCSAACIDAADEAAIDAEANR